MNGNTQTAQIIRTYSPVKSPARYYIRNNAPKAFKYRPTNTHGEKVANLVERINQEQQKMVRREKAWAKDQLFFIRENMVALRKPLNCSLNVTANPVRPPRLEINVPPSSHQADNNKYAIIKDLLCSRNGSICRDRTGKRRSLTFTNKSLNSTTKFTSASIKGNILRMSHNTAFNKTQGFFLNKSRHKKCTANVSFMYNCKCIW